MNGGIYAIVRSETGESYVGRSVNFRNRWGNHRRMLRAGIHENHHLQRAWDKYGAAAFEFRKLVICTPDYALALEQRLLDVAYGRYNLSKSATTPVKAGDRFSPAHRAKISVAMTGRIRTPEHRANMSAAQTGKTRSPHSPEHRAKIGAAQKGRVFAPTHCAKISAAMTGKKLSQETRAKIGAAQLGRTRAPYRKAG